jgi:hypothetical protein
VLVALWSPKGGSGTSVLAAACAVVLARHGGVRLADLAGDQPAILGLGTDPDTGLADWLAAAPGVALVARGSGPGLLAPVAEAEAGAALAVALRDGPVPCIVDAGRATTPSARALLEVSDAAVVVMRGCYLSLRRAVQSPLLPRTTGIAFVEEAGRSLGVTEVRDVLDLPVLARVPVKSNIARTVDAGVVASRLPEPMARAAATLLARLGVFSTRRGQAA